MKLFGIVLLAMIAVVTALLGVTNYQKQQAMTAIRASWAGTWSQGSRPGHLVIQLDAAGRGTMRQLSMAGREWMPMTITRITDDEIAFSVDRPLDDGTFHEEFRLCRNGPYAGLSQLVQKPLATLASSGGENRND
jgi:hypothetical protein